MDSVRTDETMFGKPNGATEKNISDGTSNRWSWYQYIATFDPINNRTQTFDMYAGAGRHIIEYGTFGRKCNCERCDVHRH
jgi:hypothetical protein